MKNILKILLTVTMCATFSSAFAEGYTVLSKPGGVALKVVVQGGGSLVVNDKSIGKLLATPPDQSSAIYMGLNLNSDHTVTGYVSTDALFYWPSQVLFNLSGTWYRPANSKVIYIAPDGDPTMGESAVGAYGELFNPAEVAFVPVQNLMSMMFWNKVSNVSPIYSSLKFTTGVIKLKLDKSGDILSAVTDIRFSGRAMTSYCKLDSFKQCTIPNGTKDAAFSFSIKSKGVADTL